MLPAHPSPSATLTTIDLQATHDQIPPRISKVSSSVPDTRRARWTWLDVMQLLDSWCCGQLSFLSKVKLKGTWCEDIFVHWIQFFQQTLHLCPPRIMLLTSHLLKVAKILQDPSKATRLLRPLELRLVVHTNHQSTNANLLANLLYDLPSPSNPSQNLPKLLLWTLLGTVPERQNHSKLAQTCKVFG